jgi:hypothetical protein
MDADEPTRYGSRVVRWVWAIGSLCCVVGCAAGSVREARVGALGKYPEARGLSVEESGATPLDAAIRRGALRAVGSESAEPRFRLRLSILAAEAPSAPPDAGDGALSTVRSFAGLAGVGSGGAAAGRLELAGTLLAPDGQELGAVRWEHEGAPEAVAEQGGEEAARALARLVEAHRVDYAAHRAADERLLLTPTAQTMAPGEFVVSDDELLLARIGVGLARRVQLDLWAGGVPIPAAAGGAVAGPAIVGAGGAGVVVLGFFDLGLKVRVLDETKTLPGLAISYDLLDVFGLGAGGVGIVIAREGAAGLGYGVVAGANAQFNLVTAVAAKHLGRVQLTLGTWVLDNHHYLPQSASFQGACAVAGATPSSAGAGAIDCGAGSTKLPRLPVQVQPFVGSEVVLGPHSSLLAEALLDSHVENTMVTTGARWLLGASHPRGPLALDRIRFRLDVAALWFYQPAQGGMRAHGARVVPLPWLGVGFYFL